MKSRFFVVVLLMGCMSLTAMTLAAQQSGAVQGGVPASGPVPNLIKYSGVLKDARRRPHDPERGHLSNL